MRLCAWCKKDLDTDRQLTDAEYKAQSPLATHGICPPCSKGLFSPETKEKVKQKEREIQMSNLSRGGSLHGRD